MAGDLRAGGESTWRPAGPSTLSVVDVGQATGRAIRRAFSADSSPTRVRQRTFGICASWRVPAGIPDLDVHGSARPLPFLVTYARLATMCRKRTKVSRPQRGDYSSVDSSNGSRTLPPLDPMPQFDLYAELDVPPDADALVIERAWRDGVRSVHPDRARTGEERAATVRTVRLNIAREWLMDPSKRARYDTLRRPGLRAEIPTVDPLGSWPVRRRRRASADVPILLLKSLSIPGR